MIHTPGLSSLLSVICHPILTVSGPGICIPYNIRAHARAHILSDGVMLYQGRLITTNQYVVISNIYHLLFCGGAEPSRPSVAVASSPNPSPLSMTPLPPLARLSAPLKRVKRYSNCGV
ncbi:hypothetical protein F4811DRAFT_540043 [Daldinia bambusicola]|nr:hypothetical protein F4811DRAFT_540043 [Daldinia bambusicola]